MTKVLVAALLLVHGAIHALGFVKAFGFAEVPALAQPIARSWGIVWAMSGVLLVGAAVARVLDAPWWWLLGAPAVVTSQIAIIAFWSDARFGTIANALLLVPILVGFGSWRFAARVQSDVAALSSRAAGERQLVVDSEVADLPPVVERWLRRAGVVGRPRTRAVHLSQRGEMMKSPEADWMPFRAEQWFTVPTPGFVWAADVRGSYGMSLAARDRYLDGKGAMRVELLSLVPVVDARGPTIDQGALVRYLAETMWFPSAVLEPVIRWEAVDDHSARATMRHGDIEGSGLFRFDDAGDVVGFEARRYRDDKLEDWIIENDPSAIDVIDGVRIPTRSTVTWRDAAGQRWTWLRLEIVSLSRTPAVDSP